MGHHDGDLLKPSLIMVLHHKMGGWGLDGHDWLYQHRGSRWRLLMKHVVPPQMAGVARLAGILTPLNGMTVQLNHLAVIHYAASHVRTLGMTSKLRIHP